MSLAYVKISPFDYDEESAALGEMNNEERDLPPLDVDRDEYMRRYMDGRCIAFGAFDGAELVGYLSFFLSYHLHRKTELMARADRLYMHPETEPLSLWLV